MELNYVTVTPCVVRNTNKILLLTHPLKATEE